MEQLVARQAHYLEVVRSSRTPATQDLQEKRNMLQCWVNRLHLV